MDAQLKSKQEGIRIRHKTLKGVLMVLRDQKRPIPNPHNYKLPVCQTCMYVHDVKTYHLLLDDEGTIIVSTTVYNRIMALGDQGGFEMSNTVHQPPTQGISVPIAKKLIQAFNPEPKEIMNATN